MWTKFGQMAGKAISKIKKPKSLKNKIVAKHAKMAKDFGAYKGSFIKDFASGIRQEGRLLRKNVFTGDNALKMLDYPLTTGLGIGIAARGLSSKKEKNRK
jgi:hypothetical protein